MQRERPVPWNPADHDIEWAQILRDHDLSDCQHLFAKYGIHTKDDFDCADRETLHFVRSEIPSRDMLRLFDRMVFVPSEKPTSQEIYNSADGIAYLLASLKLESAAEVLAACRVREISDLGKLSDHRIAIIEKHLKPVQRKRFQNDLLPIIRQQQEKVGCTTDGATAAAVVDGDGYGAPASSKPRRASSAHPLTTGRPGGRNDSSTSVTREVGVISRASGMGHIITQQPGRPADNGGTPEVRGLASAYSASYEKGPHLGGGGAVGGYPDGTHRASASHAAGGSSGRFDGSASSGRATTQVAYSASSTQYAAHDDDDDLTVVGEDGALADASACIGDFSHLNLQQTERLLEISLSVLNRFNRHLATSPSVGPTKRKGLGNGAGSGGQGERRTRNAAFLEKLDSLKELQQEKVRALKARRKQLNDLDPRDVAVVRSRVPPPPPLLPPPSGSAPGRSGRAAQMPRVHFPDDSLRKIEDTLTGSRQVGELNPEERRQYELTMRRSAEVNRQRKELEIKNKRLIEKQRLQALEREKLRKARNAQLAGSKTGKWNCRTCSFLNAAHLLVCSTCSTPRYSYQDRYGYSSQTTGYPRTSGSGGYGGGWGGGGKKVSYSTTGAAHVHSGYSSGYSGYQQSTIAPPAPPSTTEMRIGPGRGPGATSFHTATAASGSGLSRGGAVGPSSRVTAGTTAARPRSSSANRSIRPTTNSTSSGSAAQRSRLNNQHISDQAKFRF